MEKKQTFKSIIVLLVMSCFLLTGCRKIQTNSFQYDYNDIVVFYPQHQDDEVLWAGSAIIEALKQKGSENVFVVLVSDGSGIKFLQSEQFSDWSREEKSNLRKNEFKKSLEELGVLSKNIIFLDEITTPDLMFDTMREVALDFENKYNGDVTHVAHTYELDWHPQHIKNGKVIKNLYDEEKISSCIFFIKPEYKEQIPEKEKIKIEVKNSKEYKKIEEACNAYKITDKENGFYGIGYKSDHKSFDRLLGNEKAPSILHSPQL